MRIIYFLLLLFFSNQVLALEDSLLKSLEIAGAGNKFQSERLKIAAENLANEHSVAMSPKEEPYRRKIVYAKNFYDRRLKTNLVKVKKYGVDQGPLRIKYDPQHPAADKDGYIKLPNVNKVIEKADASEAQRSYEANLAMIEVSKQMINRTLEVMK